MSEVEVSAAVALSCNASPDACGFGRSHQPVRGPSPKQIQERLDVALSAIATNELKHRTKGNDFSGYRYLVNPQEFRAWGEKLPHPFKFPPQFPGVPAIKKSDYPDELRTAIEAFEAVHGDTKITARKSPKAALLAWLEKNKPKLSTGARDRISTVANWKPQGGANKTPNNSPR